MPELDAESLVDQVTMLGLVSREQLREAMADAEDGSPDAVLRTLLRKGLEFDVVIVPQLGCRIRRPDPRLLIWTERSTGAGSELLFAPIKRARLDWLVEKATELGVSMLMPVWTARTQAERLNLERLRAHAIEAAEQSERLSVPELRSPEALGRVLAGWPAERCLIFCDESGAGEPIGAAAVRLPVGPVALLIGPEGGFDQTELDALGKLSFVSRVGLGPRVLRAETAALVALAVYQATAGDWRRTRSR